MDIDELTGRMIDAGRNLPGDIWSTMELFAIPELRKIAFQIQVIAENMDQFTPEGAKALLDMQVKATMAVIVAMTSLTLLAVQNAVNAILAAVADFVNAALPVPLL